MRNRQRAPELWIPAASDLTERRSGMKKFLQFFIKFAVAGGLLWWMIDEGKIDFHQLRIYIDQPATLPLFVAVWFVNVILIQSARWKALLWGLGINVPWIRMFQLQFVGIFFNTAMPGAVGGDVIKAVYIVRDQKTGRKTPAAMSILMDRITGLFGLFTIGAVAVTVQFEKLWDNPLLRPLLIATYSMVGGMLFFFIVVFVRIEDKRDPFLRLLSLRVPGFAFVKKIYVCLRSYRHRPTAILFSWAVSVVLQCFFFYIFMTLTWRLTHQQYSIALLACVFALGSLATALPIAPGGLGVGHAVFDKLFEMIGLTGGANIFNVFCLSMLALNLTGAIPYLFTKSKLPSKDETQELTDALES
jgi:glycosyltransferase 2 family protein